MKPMDGLQSYVFSKDEFNFIYSNLPVFAKSLSSPFERDKVVDLTYQMLKLNNPLIRKESILHKYIELLKTSQKYDQHSNILQPAQSTPQIQVLNNVNSQQSTNHISPHSINLIANQQTSPFNNLSPNPKPHSIVVPKINASNDNPDTIEKKESTNTGPNIYAEETSKEQTDNKSLEYQSYVNYLCSISSEPFFYKELSSLYEKLHNSPFAKNSDPLKRNIIEYSREHLDLEKKIEQKLLILIATFKHNFNKTIKPMDKLCETAISPAHNQLSFITKTKYQIKPTDASTSDHEIEFFPNSFFITHYIKPYSLRRLFLSDKLTSFYTGDLFCRTRYAYKIDKVEVITFVSYNLQLTTKYEDNSFENDNKVFSIHMDDCLTHERNETFLVRQPVFVYFKDTEASKGHFLNFFGIEINTHYKTQARAIYFHRDSGVNKIYLCGDCQVKEFTINGYDEYVKKAYNGNIHPVDWNKEFDSNGQIKLKEITITQTREFNFVCKPYKKPVILIRNNELILTINNSINIWNLNQADSSLLNTIQFPGNLSFTRVVPLTDSSNANYLAITSDKLPTIFIFNNKYEIVARLVSHTLGISGICQPNSKVITCSYDGTVKVWDLNKRVPDCTLMDCSSQLAAMAAGTFCEHGFLFTGSTNHTIKCWSISLKRALFDIDIENNVIQKEMIFKSAVSSKFGEFAELCVISESAHANLQYEILKTVYVHHFQFI